MIEYVSMNLNRLELSLAEPDDMLETSIKYLDEIAEEY